MSNIQEATSRFGTPDVITVQRQISALCYDVVNEQRISPRALMIALGSTIGVTPDHWKALALAAIASSAFAVEADDAFLQECTERDDR